MSALARVAWGAAAAAAAAVLAGVAIVVFAPTWVGLHASDGANGANGASRLAPRVRVAAGREAPALTAASMEAIAAGGPAFVRLRTSDGAIALPLPSGMVLGVRAGEAQLTDLAGGTSRVTVTSSGTDPETSERVAAEALASALAQYLAANDLESFASLLRPPFRAERFVVSKPEDVMTAARALAPRLQPKDPSKRVRIERTRAAPVASLSLDDRMWLDGKVARQIPILGDDLSVFVDLALGAEHFGRLAFVFRKRENGALAVEAIY